MQIPNVTVGGFTVLVIAVSAVVSSVTSAVVTTLGQADTGKYQFVSISNAPVRIDKATGTAQVLLSSSEHGTTFEWSAPAKEPTAVSADTTLPWHQEGAAEPEDAKETD